MTKTFALLLVFFLLLQAIRERQVASFFFVTVHAAIAIERDFQVRPWNAMRIVTGNTTQLTAVLAFLETLACVHLLH